MKKLILLVLLTINFPCIFSQAVSNNSAQEVVPADTSSAQIGSDSINISQMVAAQINSAREKEQNEGKTAAKKDNELTIINPKQASPGFISELERQLSISPDLFLKIMVLISAAFLAALIIVMRRRKARKLMHPNISLKENIKLLREENIRIKGNSKLSAVRNRLADSTPEYNLTKESISNSARKLNISKDEILLAQKLKRMR